MSNQEPKPGTTLVNLIRSTFPGWAVDKVIAAGCSCKNYEKKMNKWGIDGSLEREREITTHMAMQANKIGHVFRAIPFALKKKGATTLFRAAIKKEMRRTGYRKLSTDQ